MRRIVLTTLALAILASAAHSAPAAATGKLSLPANTSTILNHIYSGRTGLAIPEARLLEEQNPNDPLGYILEAEARWWKIWWGSAEFKYGMSMARHREKMAADQPYLELAAKAYVVATTNLAQQESADMHLYAGMADSLAARLYGLRGEGRNTAKFGVRARENLQRAIALDPQLADADFGLGLYNYYVDTLSAMARMLRFMMGIPGGSKEQGIRQLHIAIAEGQLTPALARYYLAINLHNFDQRYEDALRLITPLVEQYPDNPIFRLTQGDLYAKLGRKQLALASYHAAAGAKMDDDESRNKLAKLVQASIAVIGGPEAPK
jgi:tetratricopeptide (TPR) repeat protein